MRRAARPIWPSSIWPCRTRHINFSAFPGRASEEASVTIKTVAILSPGEMGAAVGRALHRHGFDVMTWLGGRSGPTRERAREAGFRETDTLEALLGLADIVLSILPPERAPAIAQTVATAMKRSGHRPPFVDCNAVSPETARRIGAVITGAGAAFIDAGIVGNPPGKAKPTRFFVSGEAAGVMDDFNGKDIDVRQSGPEIGRASAIKMCYAAITKGTSALHAAVLIAAERLGVADELHVELPYSVPDLYRRMETMVPALPAVSGRYIGEMEEIARTMDSAGLTPNFHLGATELYRLLETTPFAAERRDTVDRSRGLRRTVQVAAEYVKARSAAE
jgi:3-hydroxyisobutyrate dehydrogenase-like beta-hydroxyacid dehydrogenase